MRILYLEDDSKDAELVQETLETEGIPCDVARVDTQADFSTLLNQGGLDLILADYTLPAFDGISALKLAKEVRPEVPFIFVSGTMGEELAIEALKLGATDYVLKTRLGRLAPSVERALREAKERVQCKLAEETLRESEAYLAEALRLGHTGSWAWNLKTGDIRYWSEECFLVLGFDPQGPLPKFEIFLPRVYPEDQVLLRERFEKAVREKADFELDYRLVHPNTGVRDIHSIGHAVLDQDGNLLEFVGTVIDVTERKRSEDDLQQLVDFAPQIIVVLGPDGEWIYANRVAREYTGLSLDEYRSVDVIGKTIHPDDAERLRTVRRRGFSTTDPFEAEARIRGKDGVYRWFLFRYNPLIKHGTVTRWYGAATEIDSHKQEEERARKQNVRLEERTRIAQELHDTLLQTFLSASMQLNVLLDRMTPDLLIKPRLDRILQIMEQGIEEGRHTIQHLRSPDTHTLDLVLALSRIQQELSVEPGVDFRVIVAGRQKPLRPPVRHEIYRIGKEALVNAFRHSGAKRIEFELEYADCGLRMLVRDDGSGIAPQILREGCDGHWGLAGMRERATKIGGKLEISNSATTGTEVRLSIPSGIAFQLPAVAQTS